MGQMSKITFRMNLRRSISGGIILMDLQGDIDESQEWFLQEPGVMRLPKTIIMMMKKKRKLPTNHLQAFFQFKHMEINF